MATRPASGSFLPAGLLGQVTDPPASCSSRKWEPSRQPRQGAVKMQWRYWKSDCHTVSIKEEGAAVLGKRGSG